MATIYIASEGSSSYTALPEPSIGSYDVQIYDIDSSNAGRDQAGYMHRDRVAIKRKINCSWNNVSPSVVANIVSVTSAQFFNVKYFDTPTNTIRTGTFYAGDKSSPLYTNSAPTGSVVSSFSVNFIER